MKPMPGTRVHALRMAAALTIATSDLCAALGGTAFASAPAIEAPEYVRVLVPQARLVGAGRFTWLGFRAYDAALYAPAGRYTSDAPYALELTYARAFSGGDIAERSIDEIRKLGDANESEISDWLAVLRRLFPDVREGDRLVGVSPRTGAAPFFHNGRPVGAISDVRLQHAFFAIWLDPRTSAPALRARLIGAAVSR